MAVDHIQETDTLNAGRVKINQAIDLSNSSSNKVDQFGNDLDQGIKDAKKIATDAGAEAKTIAETAGAEAKQTAESSATEAKNIATNAGNEAKTIAETAGAEANKKADQAVVDSRTAIENSNQAIGRANQNKQEFDALEKEFDDLIAQSGDSTPEIVQARTDTQGVKQDTLQNRLAADFNMRLTNADAIKLFSGPVDVPKMMDFAGKVAGNTAANPHVAYTDYTATSLKKPSAVWSEVSQENYNKLVGRDDQGVSVGSSQGSVIPQQLSVFNTIQAIEKLAPRIFEGMTIEEKIQYIKDSFISFSVTTRAKATSPNNKNLKVGVFVESADAYTTKIQGDATEFTDFTTEINDANYIDSKGNINVLSYTDSSNGVTASNLATDFIGVQLKVSLDPLTVLNKSGFANESDLAEKADSKDFQAHASNQENPHAVTAEQVGAYSSEVADETFLTIETANSELAKKTDLIKANVGLGNVDNYATATQNEAIAGTASNKFITPLGVKQFYDQQAPELASEMLNEIIRRSPQVFELTVADKTITNSSSDMTPLTALRNQVNTDPTRFISDGSIIYISKAGTYTFDLSCSINNKGVGTYFGFQVKQSNGDQSFPGPALKAWAGDKAPVIISGSTNFEAGDQLTIYTYPANAKYEINNLRIRITYRGDDSV